MTTYESKQKQILRTQEEVYATLINLKQLETFKDKIPADGKVSNIEFSEETISFDVDPLGRVEFKIIEKEAPKIIKFGVDNLPIPVNMWIQLVGVSEEDTRMKLTLKADIPTMFKMMVNNKLESGIERIADMIAMALNK